MPFPLDSLSLPLNSRDSFLFSPSLLPSPPPTPPHSAMSYAYEHVPDFFNLTTWDADVS
jgi:hypothetical protein